MNSVDVIIVGASASGLMCAIEAGKRGRNVLVLDHAKKAAKKIRISGGGLCNFTNYDVTAEHYLSQNPHFCKSALSGYQYYDFLSLLADYNIPWHEREHGQLFCDRSANDIVQMLLAECEKYSIEIRLNTHIVSIEHIEATLESPSYFNLRSSNELLSSASLVIATGGLSISKMGATDFAHRLAQQFKLNCTPMYPGLVPLTYHQKDRTKLKALAGIALMAEVTYQQQSFKENLLFTHKGISGPVVLQISSYWQVKNQLPIIIKLMPDLDLFEWLLQQQKEHANTQLKNILAYQLPKRLIECFCVMDKIAKPIKQYSSEQLKAMVNVFQNWQFWPDGTEGYRVAEVTVGGVDTDELSSKTMQCKKMKQLYFIGEAVDVTGHLGGYNFQWAWSSGYAAGQYV